MGGIKIRRAVLLILAVVFMAMVVKPAPADDDISEAVLNQAKDKLIAELDRRGYPRVAQFFGQMDPKKWGQYAGRLSAGEYGAVINDILNEQKDAIMTDLYERGKAYAAQNELLGGNTMTYIGYAEKHGGALLAMADEAWEGNYGRAGDILFEHVKAEIKSQVEGRLKKFTLEMIEAGMNEALGHVITNAGGIFLKIIELEIMAIEAFEEWSKYYFSTFQVKKPDGSVEHRELCTQYEYNRKEMGWSPDDAMRLNPSGEKGAPVPIEDMIVLGGYFYGADNMDRDQVMNVLEACYIGRHTSKSKMQEAISRGKKRADRMIFEEIRTGMKQGEETLITILDGIDFPKDVNINITVKDNETREVIPGATVKFGSNSKTASSGTATFRASLAELQANGGLNQFEVYAEAEGYEPHTGNISGSTLTSRINKETFTIDIPIAISKKKGPKPTALAINPPSVELTIGESQTFTALLALDDGSSRDVTNDPNIVWTGGTLQNSFEATVEGSFTISASYTEPESGSSITGTAQIQVKAPEPPPVPDCPPREHWDPMLKKCVCDSGYVWDELTKQCIEKKKERQRQDRPGIRLTKAASAAEVPVDSSVVYTLTVSNAGNVPLTGIRLSDNVCPNLQFVSGDGNGNGVLDTLEVWTYKGAQILSQPGPVVNTATVTGIGPGGAAVTDAAAVTVTVIRGLVTVPDLYDLLEATAEYDIREAGLTVGTVQNESSDVVSPGRVTRQTPAAGTKVPAKTAVSFWVSKSDPKFIYLDPPRSTITVDSTVAFTATLIYEDGAEEVLNPAQVQWTPGPGNSFRGTTIGTFIITAVYRDAQGAATVAVVADDDDSDLWGWGDPISHADDTLAVGLQPTPDMYEWYALCKKGVGEVYYGKDRDPTRFFVMAGPFPGPRSVKKWIDDNCPRWRCTLEGACADDPAHGGPWKVLCNKTDGSVVLGKESDFTRFFILAEGFLGEPDARLWVEQNCPSWRCDEYGACASGPVRGGDWNVFCDPESGEVTIGKGFATGNRRILDGNFRGEPDARLWVNTNCPSWRCTKDGTCATGPATGGDWYVFCSADGAVMLGSGQEPTHHSNPILARGFLGEPDARLWVNQNCPSWRCTPDGQCTDWVQDDDDDQPGATDDDIDDAIDDINDDVMGDCDEAMVQFSGMMFELDGLAADFYELSSFFDQGVRDEREVVCANQEVQYALTNAARAIDSYQVSVDLLAGLLGDVAASCVDGSELAQAEEDYSEAINTSTAIQSYFAGMQAIYAAFECDKDASETDSDDVADDNIAPEDIGGGVEVCGDGIDNDGDNEIDECDAGCCDKNVQVTVTDCGTAADDVFLIAVDGKDLGVTPKGAANTFNIELSPGPHAVMLTCLDDGGEFGVADDIGTACVYIVIFGGPAIGGDELPIGLGASTTIGFTVPEGDEGVGFQRIINGSSLQHLEQKK